MNAIITRNGEIIIAVVATVIALLGAFAHISEPIERAASHSR